MPLAIASSTDTISAFRGAGIRTVATTPDTSELFYEVAMTGGVALVIGSEQYGLSDTWLSAADQRARIPMAGSADSLNAAMAAAVTLFEAVRQRSTADYAPGSAHSEQAP